MLMETASPARWSPLRRRARDQPVTTMSVSHHTKLGTLTFSRRGRGHGGQGEPASERGVPQEQVALHLMCIPAITTVLAQNSLNWCYVKTLLI